MIKMTKVKNPSNPIYKSRGGKTTNNKLFLLSMTDMINTEYGFSDDYEAEDINRRCSSTKYASIRGAIANRRGYETAEGEGSCLWWLRTPGMEEGGYTCCVEAEGYVETMGVYTSCGNRFLDYSSYGVGVRPVMYISI